MSNKKASSGATELVLLWLLSVWLSAPVISDAFPALPAAMAAGRFLSLILLILPLKRMGPKKPIEP